MNFNQAIKIILKFEGGYVNDPTDVGGETNFGISKRQFPNIEIKELTQEGAETIYYGKYWLPMKLGGINNSLLQLHLLDMGVNAGPGTAVKLLQDILNVTQDGVIGPKTLAAVNEYANQDELTRLYQAKRNEYYTGIVNHNPKQAKFLKGWLSRVDRVSNEYNLIKTV